MPLELFVGPFPKSVNLKEKEQLLKHFGASDVIHFSRKRQHKPNYIKGIFKSEEDCEYALKNIHQIKLLNKRLNAKYCDNSTLKNDTFKLHTEKRDLLQESSDNNSKLIENLGKYESQLYSISSKFGFNFPISPKIRYSYPAPTASTLVNILNCLASVPEFYTQVLHLMNKLNLPCPFGKEISSLHFNNELKIAFQILLSKFKEENYEISNRIESDDEKSVCDSESELESDEHDEVKPQKNQPKRIMRRKKNMMSKKPKLHLLKASLVKRTPDDRPKNTTENVFDHSELMGDISTHKKLEVHLVSSDLSSSALSQDAEQVMEIDSGFGKIYPVKRNENEIKEKFQFITKEDLKNNRIPKSDWPLVPAFKNYNKGTPSNRLYIKNLGKNVTENDLKFIFGSYVPWDKEEESQKFSIKLMKEGRMKGQAFITFHSEECASAALSDVNAYILKDKPMVVMYGKVKENN